MHPSKTCFLNVGIGLWYIHGTDRLKGSLVNHGFEGDILTWKNEWPSEGFSRDCVYNVKPAAFAYALDKGYETIIWGDCSIYALGKTREFVDRIRRDGYWIGMSGYNGAQVAGDRMLEYFDVTRDEAQQMPDTATGIFGVHTPCLTAKAFIDQWVQAGRDGAFHGSRHHAGQSKDPRFLFGRQDQAAATLIAGKLRMKLSPFSEFCRFAWDKFDTTFHCQGM